MNAEESGGLIPELTDDDVYDAMQHLPGYLDITTEDFRALYRLAFSHAVERLTGQLRAHALMRSELQTLSPELNLVRAVEVMAGHGLKSLPVSDARKRVVGMLSEADILHRLGVDTCLELMLRSGGRRADGERVLGEETVESAMTQPATTVTADADFAAILKAFHAHGGRRMPVVDAQGRLLGMLARKDFIAACPLGVSG